MKSNNANKAVRVNTRKYKNGITNISSFRAKHLKVGNEHSFEVQARKTYYRGSHGEGMTKVENHVLHTSNIGKLEGTCT